MRVTATRESYTLNSRSKCSVTIRRWWRKAETFDVMEWMGGIPLTVHYTRRDTGEVLPYKLACAVHAAICEARDREQRKRTEALNRRIRSMQDELDRVAALKAEQLGRVRPAGGK